MTTTARSGRIAWVLREFLGGVHVVSRRAVETIGGYNTTDFPEPWGFHDCEYGLRLRAAGLLEASWGHYVDPVMRPVLHADAPTLDTDQSSVRRRIIEQYHPTYLRRVVETNLGQRIFHPFRARA